MPLILEDQEKPFPFLSLTPKLRQKIYEYILLSATPIEIHCATRRRLSRRSSSPPNPGPTPSPATALLQTNRQIRREAAPLYRSANTFVIPWGFPNLGCAWLEALPASHRRALRDVRICYGDGAFWSDEDGRAALGEVRAALQKSGVGEDLEGLGLWVPVAGFAVHTWKALGVDGVEARWVGKDEVREFD